MTNELDKPGMLRRLARLKGSALRRLALGRSIVVMLLATTISVAGSQALQTVPIEEKPFNPYNKIVVKARNLSREKVIKRNICGWSCERRKINCGVRRVIVRRSSV